MHQSICYVGIGWYVSNCTAPRTIFHCTVLGREIAGGRATSIEASRLWHRSTPSVVCLQYLWRYPCVLVRCYVISTASLVYEWITVFLCSRILPFFSVSRHVTSRQRSDLFVMQRGHWSEVSWRRKPLVSTFTEQLTTFCVRHLRAGFVCACVLRATRHAKVGQHIYMCHWAVIGLNFTSWWQHKVSHSNKAARFDVCCSTGIAW